MKKDKKQSTKTGEILEEVEVPQVEAVRKKDGTFAKGNTGNLKGRPKGSRNKTISAELKKMLDEELEVELPNGQKIAMTYKQAMLKSLMSKAVKNKDVRAMELIFNRTDGKVPQPVEFVDKSVLEKNLKVKELMEGFERMGDKWFLPPELKVTEEKVDEDDE